MDEKEKQAMYIANCKTCMLAQAMKNCPLCQFNIGLLEKQEIKPEIRLNFHPEIGYIVNGTRVN